ncbi:APC family permease [Sulfurimonas paralvinellae]|uniref:Amino acid permease n=1 Tax=Sulfurimonas paralvinellae TaxID=317658 RepID=A0A7M1B6W6_9BACT|nr:APC family permease [Sulfurimonas paralvinellae]QOP45479.1 amino acid permease [Sulfurimonas paralvinellae]
MRSIGLLGAISIGIGGMVGGGIFAVLGEAVSLAHGATAVAFGIAGLVAILTAYSYAKLSVTYQSEGGTVTFIDKAFGDNILSGSVNLMLWLSYLVTISLYATAFASYGETFFTQKSNLLHHGLITFAILLPAVINLVSASFVGKSETVIVVIKVSLLILVIVAGASYVDTARMSPEHWGTPLSIVTAGMIIFVAYEGFELIANSAEDIKEPLKNLPRAFYASVGIVIVLYILIAIITVGSVSEDVLMKAKDYALAAAAQPSLGHTGFVLVSFAALLSTFSAINATIYGNARLGYIVAKDGKLPRSLMDEDKKSGVPFRGVLYTTLLSLILANSIDLTEIAIIGSAGFLLIFTLVNLSAYTLREEIGANKFVVVISSILAFLALCTLMLHTYNSNPRAVVIFMSFIIISVLFELIYGRYVRGQIFNRKYKKAKN